MASDQVRKDNVRGDVEAGARVVHVEKDRVPKMTTHFESLGSPGQKEEVRGYESGPGKVGGVEFSREVYHQPTEGGVEKQGFSNEEISGYRQQAQQGSMDALRGAEGRYNQAKGSAAEKGAQAKDTLAQGAQGTTQYMAEKGDAVRDISMEKAMQAKDTLAQGAQRTSQYVAEKGGVVKDTAMEKGMQAKDTLAQGAQRTSQYVAEKGGVVKDTAMEKGMQAKDSVAEGAQKTAQYVAEKGGMVKDTALEKGQVAKEQTTTMAGKAKDAVVKTAVDVKDRAAAAGWAAAEYATGLTVEGTKKAVDVTKGVAGYAGEKVGVVKDKVVETEESARDYAARKREEARRELEAKKTGYQKEEMGERTMAEETVQKPRETIGKFYEEEGEQQSNGRGGGNGGGVLQAIGETIVGIAHTTKDLVIGEDDKGQRTVEERTQRGEHQKL